MRTKTEARERVAIICGGLLGEHMSGVNYLGVMQAKDDLEFEFENWVIFHL